jgi:hypothetical protein
MNRTDFGPWGRALSDSEFAQAFGALVFLSVSINASEAEIVAAVKSFNKVGDRERTIIVDGEAIRRMASAGRKASTKARETPAALLQAWRDLENLAKSIRVEFTPADPETDYWLLRELTRPELKIGSVYVRVDHTDVPVAWDWPIRIGFLGDERSQHLRRPLTGSVAPLVRFLNVELTDEECDILVLPFHLRGALGRVLALPRTARCDVVLVLGGERTDAGQARRLMAALREETDAAGVAILSLPAEDQSSLWLKHLVTQLSHNEPLDRALFRFYQDRDSLSAKGQHLRTPRPFIVASKRLIEASTLSFFTMKFATHLEKLSPDVKVSLPPKVGGKLRIMKSTPLSLPSVGAMLRENVPSFDWQHESGDATSMVELRDMIEETVGRPVRLPKSGEGRSRSTKKRYLQAMFFERRDEKRNNAITNALQPDHTYRVDIHIGSRKARSISLKKAFRQPEPRPEGHWLEVIFCDLRDDDAPEPQTARIHLPSQGDSEHAAFYIAPKANDSRLQFRVVVIHEGRVLQTMLIEAPVVRYGESTKTPITAREETIVKSDFENLAGRQSFDAVLVMNHTASGKRRVLTRTRSKTKFFGSQDLDKAITAIQIFLEDLTSPENLPLKLSDEILVDVIWKLASHGKVLWRCISDAAGELANATRIQVVEARSGSLIPIEFLYPRLVPASKPKLCPHAKKALETGNVTSRCPNHDSDEYVCPVAFWGLSRVIERRPNMPTARSEYELSEPTLERPQLDLFESVALGASARVTAKDLGKNGLSGALSTRIKKSPTIAKAWSDWKKVIKNDSPALLVLLPHSLEDPKIENMAALEIGNDSIPSSSLDAPYVMNRDLRKIGPVVFLLGCSTGLTDIRLQTFVTAFKQSGASLVLGTLSSINGQHASRFVPLLLDAVGDIKKKQKRVTFGDALLKVRQQLLAKGNPFALTLIAYGDADWLV